MPDQKYNLTAPEAIVEMQGQLEKMRAQTNRDELVNLSSDDAFEKGYEVALYDLRHYTGPSPAEQFAPKS